MLLKGNANILIDGQFGSTGKGLLAGYIAHKTKVKADFAVTNAAPNAGHTFYEGDQKIVAKHLPMYGILDKNCVIYLNAGAVIKPDVLLKEMSDYGVEKHRVVVHPRAGVITETDIHMEKQLQSPTTQLASTQSGVGSAISRKVNRYEDGVAENHPDLADMCGKLDLNSLMEKRGATVLIETPQGIGLGLNDGYQYPYCTSRNVSISQSLADANIHPRFMGATFLSMRTFPIRVGNLQDENGKQIGYSGDFYPDSVESTFEELGQEDEYTTVTGRVRRVATFSYQQYKEVCESTRPDFVFLNFVNYLKSHSDVIEMVTKCEHIYRPGMWLLGHGAKLEDVALTRPLTGREY
jgi:adenylosuccinate synthase